MVLGLFLLRGCLQQKTLFGRAPPLLVYLLIKAAVDGTPADLHEALGGDEHLVDPLPYKEQWQAGQAQRVSEAAACFSLFLTP